MDFIKDTISKASGSSNEQRPQEGQGQPQEGQGQPPQGQQGGGQKEDYLDKGVDAVEKKFGLNVSRENNEKYTDEARELVEGKLGKKAPGSFSN